MKEKGEELLVITKRTFLLVLTGIALFGILIGYTIGYITNPVKEVFVQKTAETEKTVLPSINIYEINKSEPIIEEKKTNQIPSLQNEKKEDNIIKEAEAVDKNISEQKEKKNIKETKATQYVKKTFSSKKYTVQLGAFSDRSLAEAFIEKLKNQNINAYILKEKLFKVRVGYYKNLADAQKVSQNLNSKGFDTCIKKIVRTQKEG